MNVDSVHYFELSPITQLFNVLWRRKDWSTGKGEHSTRIHIPDTVLWENNIPKYWYYYNSKEGILRRKVESNTLYREFTLQKPHDGPCAMNNSKRIFAVHYSKVSNLTLSTTKLTIDDEDIYVEYLTGATLFEFLFEHKNKGTCILQKFVKPQNKLYNDLIHVVWSPTVTLFARRQNIHLLKDYKIPCHERTITFEGPNHYSREVHVTTEVKERVEAVCKAVADHFTSIDTKYRISRMVLFMKVTPKMRLLVLSCPSVRTTPAHGLTTASICLSLNTSFVFNNNNQFITSDNKVMNLVSPQEIDDTDKQLQKLMKSCCGLLSIAEEERVKPRKVEMSSIRSPESDEVSSPVDASALQKLNAVLSNRVRVRKRRVLKPHPVFDSDDSEVDEPHKEKTAKALLKDIAEVDKMNIGDDAKFISFLKILEESHHLKEDKFKNEEQDRKNGSLWKKYLLTSETQHQLLKQTNAGLIDYLDDLFYRVHSHFLQFPMYTSSKTDFTPFEFEVPLTLYAHFQTLLTNVFDKLNAVQSEEPQIYVIDRFIPLQILNTTLNALRLQVQDSIRRKEETITQRVKAESHRPIEEFSNNISKSRQIQKLTRRAQVPYDDV